MTALEKAQNKFDRSDRLYQRAKSVLVGFVIITLMVVVSQLIRVQNTIARNQEINSAASVQRFENYNKENARQHEVTRQYVKCIATVLLEPINQRTNVIFDSCSDK